MDASGALPVSPELIHLQDLGEVLVILTLPLLPDGFSLAPVVVTGSGYPGHFTQGADAQKIVVLPDCVGDKLVLYFCRCLYSHCF